MLKSLKYYALWLVLAVLAAACGGSKDDVVPEPQYLVSATFIGEYTKANVDSRFQGNALVNSLTRNAIKAYKVVYKTKDLTGKEIQASGAVIVPVATSYLGVISQQHGTIFNDLQAPSYYRTDSEAYSIASLMGAAGYIVSCPDYLGYGASNTMPHPYQHAKSLASASLDMLRATKEFLTREQITQPTKTFLTGYSEGGFATMALHKKIEEEKAEFTITANASGAGAYHTTRFFEYIATQNRNMANMDLYLWVIQAYNQIYGLNRAWNTILNEPFATQAQTGGFSAVREQNPQALFRKEFIDAVRNGSDPALAAALRDNDIHDWKPNAPVALFHGDADDTVPFFNSQNAFNAMKARGATVELTPAPGGTHLTTVPNYILGAYMFFARFQ